MKKILAFIACILFCATAWGQIDVQPEYMEYEPVVAHCVGEADLCLWTVVKISPLLDPENYPVPATDIPVGDIGKTVVICGEPGRYQLKLDAIKIFWEEKRLERKNYMKTFVIQSREVGPTPPGPDPPGPDPPGPDPPGPDPVNDFQAKVQAALETVPASAASYATSVGGVYAAIAAEAEALPNSWDAATMVNEAKVRNTSILPITALQAWQTFFSELAQAFRDLKLSPNDLEGHIKAFKDIAAVLT